MSNPNIRINGNKLPDPTELSWNIPEVKGIDGFGNKRYDPYYSFELKWDYLTQAEYYNLMSIWQGHYLSGSAVVNLPGINDPTYQYHEYSGTVIDKPEMGNYYTEHGKGVKVIIRKIRVS
jgi:hypothetical protein